jgi:hypothetical protein
VIDHEVAALRTVAVCSCGASFTAASEDAALAQLLEHRAARASRAAHPSSRRRRLRSDMPRGGDDE